MGNSHVRIAHDSISLLTTAIAVAMPLFNIINDSSQVRSLVLRYASSLIQMFAIVAILTCYASVSHAQIEGNPATSPTIEEKTPSFYYLPVNGNGEYKRVVGTLYEEFEKWALEQLEAPTNLPSITYSGLKSVAHVEGNTVILDVTMELKALKQGWIQVPLGFRKAILKDPPIVDSSIESRLAFYDPEVGYSCWLNIKSEDQLNETITLTYSVIARVIESNDSFSVNLHYPASFSCELDFRLQKENPWIETSTNVVSEEIIVIEGTSSKRIQLAGDTLQLRWGFQEKSLAMETTELRVSGSTVLVTVNDENQISSKATLRVESINGLLKSFDVHIADNAELVSRNIENKTYTLRKVTRLHEEKNIQVVRVDVLDPTLRSIEIDLHTIQNRSKSKFAISERFEIGLFEVLGSNIQDGDILLNYKENVTVSWDDRNELQVEPGEEYYDKVKAAFHYPSQPAGLKIGIKPSRTSLTVQPAYRLMLGKEEAQLEARFIFSTPVGFNDVLKFDIADWQIEEIDAFASNNRWIREIEDGKLTLTLMESSDVESSPAIGNRVEEIVLKARRLLDFNDSRATSAQRIELPWIVPSADVVEVSAVEVEAETTILATPIQTQMPDFRVDRLQNAGSEEKPNTTHFRLIPQSEKSFFVFELEHLRPLMTIESQVNLKVLEAGPRSEVIQTFHFNVFHRQLKELSFYHSLDAAQLNRLTAFVNEKEVTLLPVTLEQDTDTQVQSFRLPLTSASSVVEVQFRFPIDAIPRNSDSYPVRLIAPKIDASEGSTGVDVLYRSMRVQLESPQSIKLSLADKDAKSITSSNEPEDNLFQEYLLDQFKDQLELISSEGEIQEIQIQHSWLQAVYGNNERRDRVCFLLKTSRPEIQLKLPKGIHKFIEVRWNQIAITERFDNAEKTVVQPIRIPTGASTSDNIHVLELWYDLQLGHAGADRNHLALPSILDSVQINKTYLQIATPENWACLGSAGWANEMRWNWQDLQLQRTLEKNQGDLEKLLNASPQEPVSKMPGLDVYLFSKIGTTGEARVTFVRRSHLFLCLSGASLIIGLIFFYLPATRKTWLLWTLSVGLFCSGLLYPTYTLLAGQLASLGVALALLSMILSVVLQWMQPKRAVIRGIASDSHHSTEFFKDEDHISNHSTATLLDPSVQSAPQPKAE